MATIGTQTDLGMYFSEEEYKQHTQELLHVQKQVDGSCKDLDYLQSTLEAISSEFKTQSENDSDNEGGTELEKRISVLTKKNEQLNNQLEEKKSNDS